MDNEDTVKIVRAERYALYVRSLELKMLFLREEIQHQEQLMVLTGVGYGDKITTSPTDSKVPDGIIKLFEMIEAYNEELSHYVEEHREAHACFTCVDHPYQAALVGHYILCKTWEQLCVEMHYSYRGMMKLREGGLLRLYDHMPMIERDNLPRAY